MGFGDYVIEKALQDIKDESWVSLHFDDPEAAGGEASEITGSGYVRKQARFGPIANRTMWVSKAIAWQGMPQAKVTHLAGWTKQFNGQLQWSARLGDPVRILEGKGFTVAENEIALSFS